MNKQSAALGNSIIVLLLGLVAILGWQIAGTEAVKAGIYVLDVGQGDSTLVVLKNDVRLLIDGGPDRKVVSALEKILGPNDRNIDIVIITHPQADHFNGLREIAVRYSIGAAIINGRSPDPSSANEWRDLLDRFRANDVPVIAVGAGSKIKTSAGTLTILAPDGSLWQSAELNDTGLVARLATPDISMIFSADISSREEESLLDIYGEEMESDVLKVAHHGSKYSSGKRWLETIRPRIATVSSGRNNRYGHPAPETIGRLENLTPAMIFRTDEQGTISIFTSDAKADFAVFTEK